MSKLFRTATPLLLCLLILTVPAAMAAQKGMWRWKDDSGNLNYSDTPPKGVDAEFIASDAVGTPPADKKAVPAETEKQTATGGGSDLAGKPLEVMPEPDMVLCKQARDNLATLSDKPRIRITEDDGTKRVLTPEEIEGEKDRARKFIDLYCPK